MRTWNWIPVAALLSTGCIVQQSPGTEDLGPGTVDFTWQVGASGCELSGVTDVEVFVGTVSAVYPCTDGGGTLSVADGSYDLVAVGYDETGAPRYEGTAANVRVYAGGSVSVPTVRLEALPAQLELNWFFENGRLCGSNDVDDVDVVLFKDDRIELDLVTPCDDGTELIEEVPAGLYTVSILGRDSTGTARFSGESDVELLKGDFSTVDIQLSEIVP
ncbi:MAG TPA: hypothetical protein ENK18_27970 [Deltaproteobacteria bacterium]|nr:hypothetical protein [Deltaproteobacteria bacterium]